MASFDASGYVKDLEKAWNAKDPDMHLSRFADTVEFQDPRATTTSRGKAALRDAIAEWFSGFSEMQMRVKDSVVTPRTAAILYEVKGRHTGDLKLSPTESIPPTNKPAAVDVAEFVTFDVDGKIIKDVAVLDNAQLLMQLGLLPSNAAPGSRPATQTSIR